MIYFLAVVSHSDSFRCDGILAVHVPGHALISNGTSGSGWKAHSASVLRNLQHHSFQIALLLPDLACTRSVEYCAIVSPDV